MTKAMIQKSAATKILSSKFRHVRKNYKWDLRNQSKTRI